MSVLVLGPNKEEAVVMLVVGSATSELGRQMVWGIVLGIGTELEVKVEVCVPDLLAHDCRGGGLGGGAPWSCVMVLGLSPPTGEEGLWTLDLGS